MSPRDRRTRGIRSHRSLSSRSQSEVEGGAPPSCEGGEPDRYRVRCDFCFEAFLPPRWNCRTCHRCAAAGLPDQSLREWEDYIPVIWARQEEALKARGGRQVEALMAGDPLIERNLEVLEFARRHRFRTERREDGEVVILVRGGNRDHLGKWGPERWYFCAERRDLKGLARRARRAVGDQGEVRVGDLELLLLMPESVLVGLLNQEPSWFRPKRRPGPRRGGQHLSRYRFRRAVTRAAGTVKQHNSSDATPEPDALEIRPPTLPLPSGGDLLPGELAVPQVEDGNRSGSDTAAAIHEARREGDPGWGAA